MSGEIIHVDFHGDTIFAAKRDKNVLIAVRPIVERLGLGWSSQLKRLKREVILAEGVAIMTTETPAGPREMVCLPLWMMPGFLFGIGENQVKPELRERVILYKRECYEALYEHFYGHGGPGERSHPALLAFEPVPAGLSRSEENRWLATASAHDAAVAKLERLKRKAELAEGVVVTTIPSPRFAPDSFEVRVQGRDPFDGSVRVRRPKPGGGWWTWPQTVDPEAEGLVWGEDRWRWPGEAE